MSSKTNGYCELFLMAFKQVIIWWSEVPTMMVRFSYSTVTMKIMLWSDKSHLSLSFGRFFIWKWKTHCNTRRRNSILDGIWIIGFEDFTKIIICLDFEKFLEYHHTFMLKCQMLFIKNNGHVLCRIFFSEIKKTSRMCFRMNSRWVIGPFWLSACLIGDIEAIR